MTPSASTRYGLYLDIQTTQHLMYHRRGIPRFACGQAIALMKEPGLVCGLGLNPLRPFPEYLDPEILHSPLLDWTTAHSFRKAGDRGRPLAYYSTSPFELGPAAESLFPPFAMRPEVPLVATLYDLIPMMRPKYYLGDPDLYKGYFTRLETLRQADLVLTISEHTKRDALELLGLDPRRLHTIGAGVSSYFRQPATGENPAATTGRGLPLIDRPFVLTVSGAEERKNTERLIEAFSGLPATLRRTYQLVIVCKLNPEYLTAWQEVVAGHGLRPEDVVFTDLIPDSTLRALYQTASLFVFPSLYEGFGLPAAEAAACGCPTITSNTSSMPEILDFPPATFSPTDPEEMAGHIQRGLVDRPFIGELRRAAAKAASRHTWEAVGARTVEALRLLPEPRRAAGTGAPRMRLALAGPFPPTRSGIADYNLRLARELAATCDLDLLLAVGKVEASRSWTIPGTRRFPLDALGRTLNPAAYDAIVYTVGNHPHHHTTYEMAGRYPGIVWFHDTQLSGLYLSYAEQRLRNQGAGDFIASRLEEMYRERVPYALASDPIRSIDDYVEAGTGLAGELAAGSRGAIVSSEFARRLIELDMGPFAAAPPVAVIPLAVPPPPEEVEGYGSEGPTIASFGIVGHHKAPGLLIDALAGVRQSIPARLVLAGPMDSPALLEDLRRRAEAAGLADCVVFTGDLSEADYRRWLRSADCAVQIRIGTHGEGSAAINDCLSAGLPVITNSITCRELPPGTVELIEPDPTPSSLGERIVALLNDRQLRDELGAAAARYRTSNTIRDVAIRVRDLVSALPSPGGQP